MSIMFSITIITIISSSSMIIICIVIVITICYALIRPSFARWPLWTASPWRRRSSAAGSLLSGQRRGHRRRVINNNNHNNNIDNYDDNNTNSISNNNSSRIDNIHLECIELWSTFESSLPCVRARLARPARLNLRPPSPPSLLCAYSGCPSFLPAALPSRGTSPMFACPPRSNWNDTEKISMAPAQGWHAQIEECKRFYVCASSPHCLPRQAWPHFAWQSECVLLSYHRGSALVLCWLSFCQRAQRRLDAPKGCP